MTAENDIAKILVDKNITHNFLVLLSGAIFDNDTADLVTPVEWNKILKLAEYHNVYSIVFEQAAKCSDFADSPNYDKYIMMKATAQIAFQANRTAAFLELYRRFSENGIYPIVMKGIVCRQLYGKLCDHRPSGDEDILVKKDDYPAAKLVLDSCGYSSEESENLSADELNELQEVSFYNSKTKLYIELHINPMGKRNESQQRMNDCFTDVFDNGIDMDINGVTIRTMNHTNHFLYLILHAFRHFTLGGLGIRQVLDILLFKQQYDATIDFEYIVNTLKKYNALLFYSDLIHLGNIYLKFKQDAPCEPNCPESLIDDIIQSGVFGNATQSQRTAQQMTYAAIANQSSNGKMRTFFRTVFPSRKQMISKHPELQKKPWLLPIRWIQRFGRFFSHSKKSDGNLAKESMEISKKRIELLKKYKIL